MNMPSVAIRHLPHGLRELPKKGSEHASGFDLPCATPKDSTLTIFPNTFEVIPTGLEIAIPAGYEGQVRSRSGLAAKEGVFVLNSPGTIDADYRGEVKVILYNAGHRKITFKRGDRIAQIVFAPVANPTLVEVRDLPGTNRGAAGLGSTGVERKP